jgi:hypothetical protein
MTGPGPAKEPWDDDRVTAAFRAAFDVTAPGDLENRVTNALETTAQRGRGRGPWGGWLRWSGAGLVAAAVIALVGVLTWNGALTSSPGATDAPVSPTSTPAGTPTAEFPTTIFGIDVLSVPEAILVRDSIDYSRDDEEIAVAGWYQQPRPVRCRATSSTAAPLDGDCTIEFQWLLANPESLFRVNRLSLSIHDPVGPAISTVFDGVDLSWATGHPVENRGSTPNAVVFIGHFDDSRAGRCAPERAERCRDRFVVDQVSWLDGAAHDAIFPAEVDGIPVWSVEETIDRRDAGELSGIAVAIGGWYAESGTPFIHPCAIVILHRGFLERWCHKAQEVLTDVPQEIGQQSKPVGTALGPRFSPYWIGGHGTFGQTPQPMVMIGHFEDPHANDCASVGVATCRDLFVVDKVAWSHGANPGPRFGEEPRPNQAAPIRSLREVVGVVDDRIPDAVILSVTKVEERDIAGLDPTTDLDPDGTDLVWYVRAVDAGTHRIGTFIVDDATGKLRWSAFPLPPIEVP